MKIKWGKLNHKLVGALALAFTVILAASPAAAATLKPETIKAWEAYIRLTEDRITSELQSPAGFLVQEFLSEEEAGACRDSIESGSVCVLKMETLNAGRQVSIPSGMVHHWLGSVFVPGVTLDELIEWVQTYSDHEQYFEEVEDSELLSRSGDVFEILLKLKRKKIVTVHYNTEHLVVYQRPEPDRVFSHSFTTKIAQLENPGTPDERERPEGDDNGFLWRLNSYWRYRQVAGGVIVECESVSLSRGIPIAIKWLVSGYVNSVPRESMAATLSSIREGVSTKPSLVLNTGN
jgi:hypothetical protein